MNTPESLARVAKASGCRLVRTAWTRPREGGDPIAVGLFDCPDRLSTPPDPWASARLLHELCERDARDPVVVELAQRFNLAGENAARLIHAFAKNRVRFRREKGEIFASVATTLRAGIGDCDDSQRVVYALAKAIGYPVRLVFFCKGGEPVHVACQVDDLGVWTWAEASMPARYGEHPFAALQRLRVRRTDVDGTLWIMADDGSVVKDPDDTLDLASPVTLDANAPKAMGAAAGSTGSSPLPAFLGDGFAAKLVAMCGARGLNPFDVAKLMLSESGLRPDAWNPRGFPAGQGAVGINQLSPGNWSYFERRGFSLASYRAAKSVDQLPVAFDYWDVVLRTAGIQGQASARDLYILNFLPARFRKGMPDSAILTRRGDHDIFDKNEIDPSTDQPGVWHSFYDWNTGLDHGPKGFITAGDMQISLDAQMRVAWWPALSQAITDAGGGSSPTMGGAIAVAAVIVSALAAYYT